MTSPDPIRELLEQAALDAFGLLDEFEAAHYTRSFHHAPVTVQDEIRRIQSEIASDERLLPDEEPDPSLRDRVLQLVAEAIAAEEAQLRPIAKIGRPRAPIGEGARSTRPGRRTTSAQFWRAASFALAATTVAMAYLAAEFYKGSSEVAQAALFNDTQRLQNLLEPTVRDFLTDDSQKIALIPVTPGSGYSASLFVNKRTGNGALLVHGLPDEVDAYILQVVRQDGQTEQLHRFPGFGDRLGANKIDKIAAPIIASAAVWQITDLAGNVLLTST